RVEERRQNAIGGSQGRTPARAEQSIPREVAAGSELGAEVLRVRPGHVRRAALRRSRGTRRAGDGGHPTGREHSPNPAPHGAGCSEPPLPDPSPPAIELQCTALMRLVSAAILGGEWLAVSSPEPSSPAFASSPFSDRGRWQTSTARTARKTGGSWR